MKKENFDFIFKIIVLIQLSAILIIQIFQFKSNSKSSNEVGRYKGIIMKSGRYGETESYFILDTKTGKIINE